MISNSDFKIKQIVFVFAQEGEKLSFSNDNIVVKDKDGKIKHQSTCYRLFLLCVVGNTVITSGLLQRAKKFGFSICLMSATMKVYQVISSAAEGNTLLRKRQYEYQDIEIGKSLIYNKILNQRQALNTFRRKTIAEKESIEMLDTHMEKLDRAINIQEIMGIEGSAARIYFSQMFNNVNWKGRKPRIKSDYINATLDIAYNILFQIVDAILGVYGFDTYYGVLHRCFYMRKSLVCDLMEPIRPMIDLKIRKAINLKQCKEDDFKIYDHRYVLPWENSPKYVRFIMEEINANRENIFLYLQGYYRAFMKQKPVADFPIFKI